MKNSALTLVLLVTFTMAGCGAPEASKSAPSAPPAKPAVEAVNAPAPPAETPKPTIDVATLALKIDPVCQMSLEQYPAAATAEHGGKTYGFCSEFCKKKFVESPEAMLARVSTKPKAGAPSP